MKKIAVIAIVFLCLSESGIISRAEEQDLTGLLREYQDAFGELLENTDETTIEEAFSFLKEKAADGGLQTEEGIENAIEEGKEKFGIEIDDRYIEEMLGVVEQLEDLGFDSETILDKAEGMYQEYGSDMADHTQELVADAVKDSIGTIIINAIVEFFRMLGESIKSFFTNLF